MEGREGGFSVSAGNRPGEGGAVLKGGKGVCWGGGGEYEKWIASLRGGRGEWEYGEGVR